MALVKEDSDDSTKTQRVTKRISEDFIVVVIFVSVVRDCCFFFLF